MLPPYGSLSSRIGFGSVLQRSQLSLAHPEKFYRKKGKKNTSPAIGCFISAELLSRLAVPCDFRRDVGLTFFLHVGDSARMGSTGIEPCLRFETIGRGKTFSGLSASRQVQAAVTLDRADVVINGIVVLLNFRPFDEPCGPT